MERGRRRGAGREWGAWERGAEERGEGSGKKGSWGEIADVPRGCSGEGEKKGKNLASVAMKKENKPIVCKFIVFL